MEQKPLEYIKQLQREIDELKKINDRLQYQMSEMKKRSAEKSGEMDKQITELEIRIRDLEYENKHLKKDRRENERQNRPAMLNTETIDLTSSDENQDSEHNYDSDSTIPIQSRSKQLHKCDICQKELTTKKRLETHIKIHQGGANLRQIRRRKKWKQRIVDEFICNEKNCKFRSIYHPAILRHKTWHTKQIHKCFHRGCTFSTKYGKVLNNHMGSKHQLSMGQLVEPEASEPDEDFNEVQPDVVNAICEQIAFSMKAELNKNRK